MDQGNCKADGMDVHILNCTSTVLLHHFKRWLLHLPQLVQGYGGCYRNILEGTKRIADKVDLMGRVPCGATKARKLMVFRQISEQLQINCSVADKNGQLLLQMCCTNKFSIGHVRQEILQVCELPLCESGSYKGEVLDKIVNKCNFASPPIVASSFHFVVMGTSNHLSKLHYYVEDRDRVISIWSANRTVQKVTQKPPGMRVGANEEIVSNKHTTLLGSLELLDTNNINVDSFDEVNFHSFTEETPKHSSTLDLCATESYFEDSSHLELKPAGTPKEVLATFTHELTQLLDNFQLSVLEMSHTVTSNQAISPSPAPSPESPSAYTEGTGEKEQYWINYINQATSSEKMRYVHREIIRQRSERGLWHPVRMGELQVYSNMWITVLATDLVDVELGLGSLIQAYYDHKNVFESTWTVERFKEWHAATRVWLPGHNRDSCPLCFLSFPNHRSLVAHGRSRLCLLYERPDIILLLQHSFNVYRLENDVPEPLEDIFRDIRERNKNTYHLDDIQPLWSRISNLTGLIFCLYDTEEDLRSLLEKLVTSLKYQPGIPMEAFIDNLHEEFLEIKVLEGV